jgi:hypothetical protein
MCKQRKRRRGAKKCHRHQQKSPPVISEENSLVENSKARQGAQKKISREIKRQFHKSNPWNFPEGHPLYLFVSIHTHTHTLYEYTHTLYTHTHTINNLYTPPVWTHTLTLTLFLSLYPSTCLSTAQPQTPIQPRTPTSHTLHTDLMEHYAGSKR